MRVVTKSPVSCGSPTTLEKSDIRQKKYITKKLTKQIIL